MWVDTRSNTRLRTAMNSMWAARSLITACTTHHNEMHKLRYQTQYRLRAPIFELNVRLAQLTRLLFQHVMKIRAAQPRNGVCPTCTNILQSNITSLMLLQNNRRIALECVHAPSHPPFTALVCADAVCSSDEICGMQVRRTWHARVFRYRVSGVKAYFFQRRAYSSIRV
jgi:hypothetical protein